ncbi:hypothetical protein OROMI_029714 [Orobanche minor]
MDFSVKAPCFLRVDRRRYLSCEDSCYYSISRAEEFFGKAIKPIRCYSRYSRYFMIDWGHVLHLVGVGVMAHEEERDVYWVDGDVVRTAVVSKQDFEDFKKKEGDKFIVTPLFFFEVPISIPENWDQMTDIQKDRAMDALTKGALHRMFCHQPPDEMQDAFWTGFHDKTIDCYDDFVATVDAIEKEASSLVFDFDLSKTHKIRSVLRDVLRRMLDDLRADAIAGDRTSRSEEDELSVYAVDLDLDFDSNSDSEDELDLDSE